MTNLVLNAQYNTVHTPRSTGRCQLTNLLNSTCSNEWREVISYHIDFVLEGLHDGWIAPNIMNRLTNTWNPAFVFVTITHKWTRTHTHASGYHNCQVWVMQRWSICPNTVRGVWDGGSHNSADRCCFLFLHFLSGQTDHAHSYWNSSRLCSRPAHTRTRSASQGGVFGLQLIRCLPVYHSC